MRLQWLFGALGLSLVLVLSELYALAHDLFWRIRWFDTPMHVLGGMALGAFIAPFVGQRRSLYFILLALLFVAWEIFEFFTGIPQEHDNYVLDTLHDLANDSIGAGFIYVFARKTLWHSV